MPSSPPDAPAVAITELGLPARAVTALTRAGITRVDDLASRTRRELAAVPGLGPGMIAAIRLVVPEPPGDGPSADAEDESPAAPPIPSFASLRSPQRRSALDLLVPGPPPAEPAPEEPAAGERGPAGPAREGAPDEQPAPVRPRPATYDDLQRLCAHLARAVLAVPGRALRWSVREPARCLRRLRG